MCHVVLQVLIKVEAAGVNPVDTYIRSGLYAHPPTLPYVPGADVAGVIDKVGPQVTKYKVRMYLHTVGAVRPPTDTPLRPWG